MHASYSNAPFIFRETQIFPLTPMILIFTITSSPKKISKMHLDKADGTLRRVEGRESINRYGLQDMLNKCNFSTIRKHATLPSIQSLNNFCKHTIKIAEIFLSTIYWTTQIIERKFFIHITSHSSHSVNPMRRSIWSGYEKARHYSLFDQRLFRTS